MAIKMPASFIFYSFGEGGELLRYLDEDSLRLSTWRYMYTKSGSRESSPVDNCFQGSEKKRLRIPDRFTLSGLLAPDRDRDSMKRQPFFSRILLPNGNVSPPVY